MSRREVGATPHSAGSLRIVLYPSHTHSRVAVHSLSTAAGVMLSVRMTAGLPWWHGIFWYVGSFVGVHVVMVPFMTAWHAAVKYVKRWIRGVVEEELIRFDMLTYERQLQRVVVRRPEPPER